MEPISFKWLIRILNLLLILLCAYIIFLLSPYLQPFFTVIFRIFLPFFIAGIITYLLHPFVEQAKNLGIARPLSILLIYTIFFIFITYLFIKGSPYIVKEVRDLVENIPNFINVYRNIVSDYYKQTSMMPDGFRAEAEGWLTNIEMEAAEGVAGTVLSLSGFFDYFLMIIIVPFLVFYLLKDFNLIEKAVWYLTPRKWRKSGIELIKNINISLGNYIRGQLIVCIIVAVIATIGLWFIGMPYAVILGTFIGLTNIIPYFGPIIGALPVAIIAFTESFQLVLLGLAVNFGIQLVEGNILSPLIVGKSLHIHPILIMFALVVGAELGGIIGLIFAVPILAVVKVIMIQVRIAMQKKHEEEVDI